MDASRTYAYARLNANRRDTQSLRQKKHMKTKHLEDLYSWKQISKLQQVFLFNRHNDFVPIPIYAPNGGVSVQYSRDEHYEWSGKKTPYYAKRLWEEVRKELTSIEKDYLAFDIVSASECFNTIQFRNSEKVHKYCDEFMRLLKTFADDGKVKCAIGRAPARPYPWDTSQRYEEYIISDDAEFIPSFTLDLKFYNSVPEYSEEERSGKVFHKTD